MIQFRFDILLLFIKDRSGHISKKELKKVFKALNIYLDDKEIQTLIKLMDTDGNGEVSYNEFKAVMVKSYFSRRCKNEQLEAAFKKYDIDGNGFLTVDEIQLVMTNMGRHMTRTEVKSMIQSLDSDRNGKISFDEFLKLFN
jgi:Ca2+-binding EF-hand superfamily protein